MSFTVETGTGASDSNAYISVAFADTYHADRGRTDWTNASTAQKQAAIVRASDFIDSHYMFVGYIAVAAQAMDWPRKGVYDIYANAIGDDEIPPQVEKACAEYARIALTVDLFKVPDGSVKGGIKRQSDKVGPLETEIEYVGVGTDASNNYRLADGMLKQLTASSHFLLRA